MSGWDPGEDVVQVQRGPEPGDAVLTTSSHWAPYDTLCEEHQRTLATFAMFEAGSMPSSSRRLTSDASV